MLRKIVFTILFTVFCTLPIFASAPVWRHFNSAPNIEMYVDGANISKTEDYAVVWIKLVMPYDYALMQWLVTRDGHVSSLYGRTCEPNGIVVETFPGKKLSNSPVSRSATFKEIYDLVW